MDNRPIISVITPLYNAQRYIAQTIESVLSQTYTRWEMIIVDNCSTDASKAIVRSFNDSRIKLIELDYNSGGPGRPRNIGVVHAHGDYIAFLDADDLWDKNKLEEIAPFCGYYDIIYHNETYFSDTISNGTKVISKNIEQVQNLYTYLLTKGNVFSTSAMVVHKKCLIANNFTESYELQGVEDYDLWLAVSKGNYQYKHVNKFLGFYREYPDAYSKNIKRHGERERKVINKHFKDLMIQQNNTFSIRLLKILRLLKSIVSNVKATYKMKQPLDKKFYFLELVNMFK